MEKKVATSKGAKIKIEADGSYFEVRVIKYFVLIPNIRIILTILQETVGGGVKKMEKATITLADCLACSGCITSAETVLIEQQSADQVIIIMSELRFELLS